MCIYSCKGICIFNIHTLLSVHMYLDLDYWYICVCVYILYFIPLGNSLSLYPSLGRIHFLHYLPCLQHLYFGPYSYKWQSYVHTYGSFEGRLGKSDFWFYFMYLLLAPVSHTHRSPWLLTPCLWVSAPFCSGLTTCALCSETVATRDSFL